MVFKHNVYVATQNGLQDMYNGCMLPSLSQKILAIFKKKSFSTIKICITVDAAITVYTIIRWLINVGLHSWAALLSPVACSRLKAALFLAAALVGLVVSLHLRLFPSDGRQVVRGSPASYAPVPAPLGCSRCRLYSLALAWAPLQVRYASSHC